MLSGVQTEAEAIRDAWDNAATGWNKHSAVLRAWLRPSSEAMVRMAGVALGQRVLDLAAGAGDQTLDLAAAVGPKGRVVASDISGRILAIAAQNAQRAGFGNVETRLADAAQIEWEPSSFDAAVCRLGLMLMPDPGAAVARVFHGLAPKARFCALVFAGPEQNPCLRILMSTALRHAGLPPRDPFQPGGLMSLGQAGAAEALLRQAGFSAVATTLMSAPFRMATTAQYLGFVRDAAGPILQILAPLTQEAKRAAWADMEQQLAVFQTGAGWEGPNMLVLAVGQKP